MKKAKSTKNGAKPHAPFTTEISKKLEEREIDLENGEGSEVTDLLKLLKTVEPRRTTPKHST